MGFAFDWRLTPLAADGDDPDNVDITEGSAKIVYLVRPVAMRPSCSADLITLITTVCVSAAGLDDA